MDGMVKGLRCHCRNEIIDAVAATCKLEPVSDMTDT